MTFQDSIKSCFNKYGSINGRATRSEFWWFQLFLTIAGIFTFMIDVIFFGYTIDDDFTPVNVIWSIAVFVPTITVTVRRLHDVNRSGWWILIAFTGIGLIPLLYWWVKNSDANDNSFGSSSLNYQY